MSAEKSVSDAQELIDMCPSNNNSNNNSNDELSDAEEIQKEIVSDLSTLLTTLEKEKFDLMFSDEGDSLHCFVEIHSGAGGTESNDWAAMLVRMYKRWAEKHQHNITVVHSIDGEETGYKSILLQIEGYNAYGWLKTEAGVHRLVRISPFSSTGKRHTSFASVWVFPVIDDNIEITINPADLRIDTYRASGAGGQHVNTTDSAVRITHIPTNIVVQSQNSRSQHKNKEESMHMLKSRLYQLELEKKEAELSKDYAQKTSIGWGHQIRSYVLHPYQMVKDLRSNYESSDITGILDGEIDEFIKSNLELKMIAKGQQDWY